MRSSSKRLISLGFIGLAATACARSPSPRDPGWTETASVSVVSEDSITLPSYRADTLTPVPWVETEPNVLPRIQAVSVPAEQIRENPPDIRICAGGDVLLGNNLDTTWAVRVSSRLGRQVSSTPDPDALLDPLRPAVAHADIVLLNVEGAIGEGPATSKCRTGSRNCYAFRQATEVAGALRRLSESGAVVGNIANNHAMDAGHLGFVATQRHLASAGVYVTGADTLATAVVAASGDTVAFLGFSTAQAGPDPRDLEAVRRHVSRAAADHARVVVTMHMGAEGVRAQRTPDESEQYLGEDRGNTVAFARAAVDAGASAVIGHGPHVMRAAEWYGGAIILYSLGNLLTYGPFSLAEPLNRGGVACVTLAPDGGVRFAVLMSTRQQPPGILAPDPTGRAAWLVDSLSQLDFPSSGARLYGVAVIRH